MYNSSFFNTIAETGQLLLKFDMKNTAQNFLILEIFEKSPTRSFTPVEIEGILQAGGHKILLTSIRRAITSLCKAGKIVKTGEAERGKYGVKNLKWRLYVED